MKAGRFPDFSGDINNTLLSIFLVRSKIMRAVQAR